MTDTNKCNKGHNWFYSSDIVDNSLRICFKCALKQFEKSQWVDYTSEEM